MKLSLFASIFLFYMNYTIAQWDPLIDDPQWEALRRKRTVGADEPYPPWNPPLCPPETQGFCMLPPYYPYDEIKRLIPNIGNVIGRSLAYMPYRYINLFLGVPYAKPPVYERRFMPPEDIGPNWDMGIRDWDASYYRDACPQELFKNREKYYTFRNMTEDCLHLNIFAPNLTDRPEFRNKNYPVMVLIVGDDFKNGDAMLYPMHLIARKEVLVITFNYRLGALGFMSTLDQNSPGNYGLMDTLQVLKFIQDKIELFGGNPNKVTLVGHGSGAAMIAILMLSPKNKYKGKHLFHQAILMSGSDLCEWSVIQPVWNSNAATYARDLGKHVGCGYEYDVDLQFLVQCLKKKHFEEIVNATAAVSKRYGSLAGPFGPVVDGDNGILPDTPANLRKNGEKMNIKVMAGFCMDGGAYLVENLVKDNTLVHIDDGIEPEVFKDIISDMVRSRSQVQNVYEVVGAIEFEYTYWAKPNNKSAIRQNLIDLWSDQMYGSCVDNFLKEQAYCSKTDNWDLTCAPVYMYMFTHRSEYEVLPPWMGVPYGRDLDYFIGYPFFNDTMGNLTGVVPEQTSWTLADRNVSDFVQMMWINFTKFGNPTPDWTRNISWYQFWRYNLSYLHIAEFSYMEQNYRQNHFAFWREYYPSISLRRPITTTPIPTPRPRIEYQVATWTLLGVCLLTFIVIVALLVGLIKTIQNT